MAEDGVRRPEGTIQSYKESVHHQFVSTMSNLESLLMNSKAMYKDYWDGRKYNVSKDSKYANQTFVVLPTKNNGRLNTLAEKLKSQDIELFENLKDIKVENATLQSGQLVENYTIPAGSMIIPNRQPEAPLIAAILEFDADIDKEVLVEERQKSLKNGSSVMYDTTAFNFTMMYGLNAVTVDKHLDSNLKLWKPSSVISEVNTDAVIWATDGDDDRSVAFAARLMEQDIEVRIIDKESTLSNHTLSRGSVAVLSMDNPEISNLNNLVKEVSEELNIPIVSIESGFGAEELPDWGGRHFRLLEKPQIAMLSHEGFNSYDVGVSWWSLDHHLGIRHSLINASLASYGDLRRYNTIIVPSGRAIDEYTVNTLLDWVSQGGTLIAHNRSTRFLTSEYGIGSVKQLQNTFDESEKYNFDLLREIYSQYEDVNKDKSNNNIVDFETSYPWEELDGTLSEVELKSRDKWQSIFMPSGAIVAGRIDNEHWLTFGTSNTIPVLYSNLPILMTGGNADAAVRIGQMIPNENIDASRVLNWSSIPAGNDLNVRMSGLVWPEASQRIANSAYLTRERIGDGQVILFSGEPNFRGATLGTNRLWLNAIVYGPGLGARQRISP
jgi:hypothetical protein